MEHTNIVEPATFGQSHARGAFASGTPWRLTHSDGLDAWLVVSWLLTVLRLPVMAALLYALADGAMSLSVLALLSAFVLLDVADGEVLKLSTSFARDEVRQARHICDAIIDRFAIHSFFLTSVYVYGEGAAAAYAPVLLREALLISITSYKAVVLNRILEANWASKVAGIIVAAIGANVVFTWVQPWTLVVPMGVFATVGLWQYLND